MAVAVPTINSGADIVAWVQSLNFKKLDYDTSWMTPEIARSARDNVYYKVKVSDVSSEDFNSSATGSVAIKRELNTLIGICSTNEMIAVHHANPPKFFTSTVTSSQNSAQEEAEISRVASLSQQIRLAVIEYLKAYSSASAGRRRKSRRGGRKHPKSKTGKRRGRR